MKKIFILCFFIIIFLTGCYNNHNRNSDSSNNYDIKKSKYYAKNNIKKYLKGKYNFIPDYIEDDDIYITAEEHETIGREAFEDEYTYEIDDLNVFVKYQDKSFCMCNVEFRKLIKDDKEFHYRSYYSSTKDTYQYEEIISKRKNFITDILGINNYYYYHDNYEIDENTKKYYYNENNCDFICESIDIDTYSIFSYSKQNTNINDNNYMNNGADIYIFFNNISNDDMNNIKNKLNSINEIFGDKEIKLKIYLYNLNTIINKEDYDKYTDRFYTIWQLKEKWNGHNSRKLNEIEKDEKIINFMLFENGEIFEYNK